ncbi:MAG: KEOPS complex N(6)-L-threonylcarbamoyladenine synthase Kae1, partial [Candidatus Micrarchaeia archaeon]
MIVLGIESTAHTLGVGVFKDQRMLSNEKDMYRPKKGGIHPRLAADHHAEVFEGVLRAALEKAKISPKDIELIAYARGPGLGPCLKVGLVGASALAARLHVKLVPVNHCSAHVEVGRLCAKMKDPLVLYVSGGNTQIIVKEGRGYHVLGETLDIGAGNMIDVFARSLGEEFAHGSLVEKMAQGGKYVQMPYTVKGMNMTFTGLLTDAVKKVESGKFAKKDVCFSVQETAFSMLTEACERALALTEKREVLACGGVAQNKRLCQMLGLMAREHGARFATAPAEFNADNGAMIAYTGVLARKQAIDWKKAGSSQ